MTTVKIKAHKRKGKMVRTHTRKFSKKSLQRDYLYNHVPGPNGEAHSYAGKNSPQTSISLPWSIGY